MISVLKLSTMWEFTDIREWTIQELSNKEIGMGAIEKIECARNFEVKRWLLDGYIELLKRAETITDEESERLGWRTAAKLLRLREQFLLPDSGVMATLCNYCSRTCTTSGYCNDCGLMTSIQNVRATPSSPTNRANHDFTKGVEKEFQEEL
jgi:hypothetical protein